LVLGTQNERETAWFYHVSEVHCEPHFPFVALHTTFQYSNSCCSWEHLELQSQLHLQVFTLNFPFSPLLPLILHSSISKSSGVRSGDQGDKGFLTCYSKPLSWKMFIWTFMGNLSSWMSHIPEWWIGKRFLRPQPPWSPDFTLLDFYL
jgi:hypothetical protein